MLYFSRYRKESIRGVLAAMELKALKNEELLESLKQCVLNERNSTVDLVCHLAELDQRKYVEELGYASLFSYCNEKLGISESATYKRITAARVLVRFPQVEGFLRNNRLNLSTLLEISSLLKPENADELFERVLGKTKREVERIALEYRSPVEKKPKDSIRRVRTAKKSVKSAAAVDLPLFTAKPDKTNVTSPGASCDEVLVEEQVQVSFSAGADLAEKIEKAQELLSGKFGTKASLEAVFNLALDALIKAKCPQGEGETAGGSSG